MSYVQVRHLAEKMYVVLSNVKKIFEVVLFHPFIVGNSFVSLLFIYLL